MIKFVKREHYKQGSHKAKIVITYSLSEIILGTLLVAMTSFYIYNYLSTNLNKSAAGRLNHSPYLQESNKTPILPKK